jgi:DNA-binding MarR family transcriptional regulator/N-acetylglutamate synthase-like GNAT family acetyltransferase
VLWELAHRDNPSANELATDLDLDPGYLSRILKSFEKSGLVKKTPAPDDARRRLLALTTEGRRAVAPLETRSQDDMAALLAHLPPAAQAELVTAMHRIEALLEPEAGARPFVLRDLRPGDLGWVISRHGALYAEEYGWDASFEALVAKIAADFHDNFIPGRERGWIAERDGVNLGSVFLVRQSDEVAKLRLLIVEPAARGLGLGKRLVAECMDEARRMGYRRMTLWTQDILTAARGIYASQGFGLVDEEPTHAFGQDMVSETWETDL